jgi:glycosyltransferase involved in cell wall biosynthesis
VTAATLSEQDLCEAVLGGSEIRNLLLVRNGVDHDARVLRAARVAARTLGARTLVVGVATAGVPAGEATVEGVAVMRLPARPPTVERLTRSLTRSRRRRAARSRRSEEAETVELDTRASTAGAADVAARTSPRASRRPLTLAERLRRVLSGIFYASQAVAVARRANPELVQANDWNTMWAGLCVKYLCGARLVYDSHELWADRNGRWEWRPWLLVCEALFVRAADEVITSSPGYAEVIAARYRIRRPTVVRNIPERPATEAGADASPPRPARPIIVYIGGLMPGRGLEQMIDALALLPQAHLRAVGPGATSYRGSLTTRAQRAGVADRLELCAPVAPGEVADALAGAAAGLCLIQPICRSYELCLPNKLFEYTAAGVPVLASELPVIGTLVRREGFGVLAPPGNPAAIAASFEHLLEPENWMPAARRARAFADAHGWTGEARALEDAYRRACRR